MSKTPALMSRNEAFGSSQASEPRAEGHESHSALHLAGFALTVAMLLLVADSLLRAPGALEYAIIIAVQGIATPLAGSMIELVDSLTGFAFLTVVWSVMLAAAAFARRWGAVVATAITPLAAATAIATGHAIATRPAPDPALLERAVQQAGLFALPSVQVAGAVLIYGLMFFLARAIQVGIVRTVVQGASGLMVILVGVSQLWYGSMWPTEVLTAYTISGLLILPLLWIAKRVDVACGKIPLVRAGNVPHDESQPHAHALTSTIIFNESTVSKIYRPGFLPRAIYWLAFQAEFPYIRNRAALQAAVQRRNLIGMLTEYWYGSSHVARAIGIDEISGRYAITSEYISGSEPTDRQAARQFLSDLVQRFESAGFPTWQIDPRQPRATDNVIETEDGTFKVVDLESGLVSPLASLRTWRRAFRRGQVPLYDDVFFDVTRSYIRSHEDAMRAEMGDDWLRELYASLDATEEQTQAWHDSEPRIWSRMLGRRRRHDDAAVREHWVVQWFEDAIASWRAEGRLSGSQATELRQKVRSPQFGAIMPHFAVHLGTGVLLRFPLGSIVRASYTAFNLGRATWQFVTGRIDRDAWREASGIHSPLVIMFAAIPGVGAFAYLASKPVRSEHLLLRVGLDSVMRKFPYRVYERTGMRWVILHAPEAVEDWLRQADDGNRDEQPAPAFAWAGEHRSGTNLDNQSHSWTAVAASGMSVRSIV